jgi:hypothetical protein
VVLPSPRHDARLTNVICWREQDAHAWTSTGFQESDFSDQSQRTSHEGSRTRVSVLAPFTCGGSGHFQHRELIYDIQTEFNALTKPFLPSSFNRLTSNINSLGCGEGVAIVLAFAADDRMMQ